MSETLPLNPPVTSNSLFKSLLDISLGFRYLFYLEICFTGVSGSSLKFIWGEKKERVYGLKKMFEKDCCSNNLRFENKCCF